MTTGTTKPEKRQSWLIWIITLLIVMNIATVATVFYNRKRSEKEATVNYSGRNQLQTTSVRYSGSYFSDELGFNEEQKARFGQINPAFRDQVWNINNDLNRLRQKMLSEMAAKNPDPEKLDSFADSIGIMHADLKKVTYRYYLEISSICDAKQKEKLDAMFGSMFISERGMGQYGRRGQEGRGRRRQFN
jgi:hypothetical protein